ncbi:MAG: hypothetical protein IPF99_41045 [Deltaproteobacteria bacterium]|nr:hypothetical protein [Deltaproteobacteria bacterium]
MVGAQLDRAATLVRSMKGERRAVAVGVSGDGARWQPSRGVFDRRLAVLREAWPVRCQATCWRSSGRPGLVRALVYCEDGPLKERLILPQVLPMRHRPATLLDLRSDFCTRAFLWGIQRRHAAFVIRQHANLITRPFGALISCGRIGFNEVFEQDVRMEMEDEHAPSASVGSRSSSTRRRATATWNFTSHEPPERDGQCH